MRLETAAGRLLNVWTTNYLASAGGVFLRPLPGAPAARVRTLEAPRTASAAVGIRPPAGRFGATARTDLGRRLASGGRATLAPRWSVSWNAK